jgi:hypothetical protein
VRVRADYAHEKELTHTHIRTCVRACVRACVRERERERERIICLVGGVDLFC